MNRIASLHALRGLAAFMVALGHIYWFPFNKVGQIQYLGQPLEQLVGSKLDPVFPLWKYLYGLGGHIPVLVFFLLSGFVLEGALKKLSAGEFLLNRILRIYPVFAVCLALILAFMAYSGVPMPSLEQILGNLTLTNNASILGVSWTLLFEMRYYLFAGLLALLGLKGWMRAWAALVLFALGFNHNFFWISFMAVGVVMHDAWVAFNERTSHERWLKALSLVAYMAVWCIVALYIDTDGNPFRAKTLMSISAILIFAGALALYRMPIRSRILNVLGNISYPLYCVHYPVLLVAYYSLAGVVSMKVVPLIALGGSLVAAWVLHRTIEKPAMGLSRKLTGFLRDRATGRSRQGITENNEWRGLGAGPYPRKQG